MPRIRLQWRLRSLLLFVAAVGVVSAWLARERNAALRRDAIVREVESVGGRFLTEDAPWSWLRFGDERLAGKRIVHATFASARNLEPDRSMAPAIARLAELPDLLTVDFEGVAITKSDMASIVELKNLSRLFLNGTGLDDEGLLRLRPLKSLRMLHLGGCPITDAGVESLCYLRNLEALYLSGTKVSAVGLLRLQGLDRLRTLDLDDCRLHSVDHGESPEGLWLRGCRHLENLYLSGTKISDDDLGHLLVPGLRALDVSHTKLSDAGIEHLAEQESIRHLAMWRWALSARSLAAIATMPQLESLSIYEHGTVISTGPQVEIGLMLGVSNEFSRMTVPQYKVEHIRDGLAALQRARPNLKFDSEIPDADERRVGSRVVGTPAELFPPPGAGGGFF